MAGAVTVHTTVWARAKGQGTVAVGRIAPTNKAWLTGSFGVLVSLCQPANLPSGAIGDQAGTARLQGSTVPFLLAFPALVSTSSLFLTPSRFGTFKYQAVFLAIS